MIQDQGILLHELHCFFGGSGLKNQHTAWTIPPVSSFGLMLYQGLDIGKMGGNMLIKGCFVNNTAFNFDKPGHDLELIYKVDIKDAKRVVINRMREEWIIASETSE
jgi:hypothetical protein